MVSLDEYFGDWLKVIDTQLLTELTNTLAIEYSKHNCRPAITDVFKVFNVTPYSELCQVWILSEPYCNNDKATGIALANKIDEVSLSPSLEVVKESIINFEVPHKMITFVPTLEGWSKQGILLLNSALTVEYNKPGSHLLIWKPFIQSLLYKLSEINPGLIYVLWGRKAQSFRNCINSNNHVYLYEDPLMYANFNHKIPYKVFTTLKYKTKELFDKEIKWYEEI